MKKKLILFLAILSVAFCLFAITAMATDIPEWTKITEVSGMPDKSTFGTDGTVGATSRVLMSDGVTYPAYYICKNQETLTIDLSSLNTNASKSYEKKDIIRIEIPKGTTTISTTLNLSSGCTGLVSVDIPYGVTTIKTLAFRSSGISNSIVIPDSCTKIESYAFKGSNISSIVIPSSVTSFGSDCVSECPSLAEVYCKCANIPEKAFYDNDNLTTIELENTVTIGSNAFCNPSGGVLNITSLELPSTVTSIGQYAFARTKLTSLVIPASVSTMGSAVFQGSTTLERVVVLGSKLANETFKDCSALKELVLTEKFTSFGSSALGTTPNNSTFITYYTGADYERIDELCSSTARFYNAEYYSYEDYKNENYTYNAYMVIYDCNLCDVAFDGVHTNPGDDGDCTTALICSMCEEYTIKEQKEHIISKRVTYLSFMQEGEYYVGCTNDGCENGTTEKLNALFECLGYSSPENGNNGITIKFTVDTVAIARYEELTGKTVKYGLFATTSAIGNNDIFDTYGDPINNSTLIAETPNTYAILNLKMMGFDTEESKSAKFAIGAYLETTLDGSKEYSYLQAGTKENGAKYAFISYNDFVK